MRQSYFVLTFPFSSVGLAQVFPGENAECVCQALKNIFEYVSGVPVRIVFDNATGVGRRISNETRTSKVFSAFAAHYGFSYSFCNPNAGHEKGSVENKVGFLRRNLFVPVRQIDCGRTFNKHLLDKCMALSDKGHYARGERELSLFMEDKVACLGLPSAPFDVVRYERHRADKYGKVCIDGHHFYSSNPAFGGEELICGLHADEVVVATSQGKVISRHRRAYGSARTDTTDPASQLPLLARKPRVWQNSLVRFSLSDDLRRYMDGLGGDELKGALRTLRDVSASKGWEAALSAAELSFEGSGRLDEASVSVAAAGIMSSPVEYEDAVDLAVYDQAMDKEPSWR